jgi:hypothetical protein
MRRDIGPTALVDRTYGEFRRTGCPQFSDQDHVEFAAQPFGKQLSHRERTARDGKDQRMAAAVGRQGFRKTLGGVTAVGKEHDSFLVPTGGSGA